MDTILTLRSAEETLWINQNLQRIEPRFQLNGRGYTHMLAAQNRFMRFLPYVAEVFPETAAKKGVIESQLIPVPNLRKALEASGSSIPGRLLLKDDAHLPIAGSVKARGGIHEVFKITEKILQSEGELTPTADYRLINTPRIRSILGNYTIQVGSTGNLGISIGRTAAKIGFQAIVHMSKDAKAWKKKLLREEGCKVIEYDGDYSLAVAQGRKLSASDPHSFFIDDENSEDLFFGYASAGMRLKVQLRNMQIPVDRNHPLFVYIPCGVGGAPGGITFGLKQMFGADVHCFFAEPVNAPCFLAGMATGKHSRICIQDLGLTGDTIADGLAVGRPSEFSCNMMESLLSGIATVSDSSLVRYQKCIYDSEAIRLETSACAGCQCLMTDGFPEFPQYLQESGAAEHMENSTHIVWATGGGLMPSEEIL